MRQFEVRQVAGNSFGVDDDRMTLTGDPLGGASKLIVHVQNLEPGLGEGRVEDLFGHEHQRLFQVNVVWGSTPNRRLTTSRCSKTGWGRSGISSAVPGRGGR